MGNALMGMKDLDGAVREIEEAIKLDPERAYAYSSLAAAKLAQGDRGQAKAALEKAVEVEPKSVRARLALAYYYWATGEVVPAEETYKQAVAVGPKDQLANRSIAAFYAGTRRPQMAEPYLKALADTGNAASILQLADFYTSLKRTDEASALLTPLAKDPAVASEAQVRLAALAYRANDKSKGHSLVDEVIAKEPRNVRALLLKADWLALEGKPREALERAQAAVKSDGTSVEAHFATGLLQSQLRMRKEAIAEFTEVLKLNPRASRAQVYLSRLNLMEGSADSAVTFAEGALSTSPQDPEARLSLVRGLLGRRDTARAEQELATLLKTYPRVGTLYAVDGALKVQKKDYAGARASYNRSLELAPTGTEALAGLTALDLFEKKPADARARVEKRLAENPNSVEVLMLAGQVYGNMRDFGRAEASLRKAIQNDSNASRAYPMLAQVLLSAGKLDQARAEFDQMVERDGGKNVGAATMAAMIVHSQGKRADAKKRYETIMNGSPTAVVAANNLAWLYQEDNEKLDDALRLAQLAAARMPDSAEVQDTIGMIYFRKELPALAISAFERSVEKSPDSADYHYHLAMALAKAGEPKRAREAAEQAIKLKPDFADAQKLLAQTKG
jgi:tetratricopeptide (TPR) repeat protein